MRKTKIEKEFSNHILWLRRYYRKSRNNPANSILLQMLREREAQTGLTIYSDNKCQLLFAWIEAIAFMSRKSDNTILKLVKEVYIHRTMNMTEAGCRYLHYGPTQTRKIVREWFEELEWQHVEAMNRIARSKL